jgi:hypothetical protein
MLAKLLSAAVAMSVPALEADAQGARYESPEPNVHQAERYRVNSTYLGDKKDNQFWVCTARYDYLSGERNQGECVRLPDEVGRPSLTENYTAKAVVGSTPYGAFLPVLWFIDPTSGDIQVLRAETCGSLPAHEPEVESKILLS